MFIRGEIGISDIDIVDKHSLLFFFSLILVVANFSQFSFHPGICLSLCDKKKNSYKVLCSAIVFIASV